MKKIIVLFAVIGFILAEAPLPYHYDPPQFQHHQQVHHHQHQHDQLNGFRPSHSYPCPDGIAHHSSEGRITNQHFETSGEPILAHPLPAIEHSDKQITVNSQIAFGEHSHSHGELSSQKKEYISSNIPVNQHSYAPQPLPIQQQVNFHGSGSIIHGVGKAPPPIVLNQHVQRNQHYHHHQHPLPIHVQQQIPQIKAFRPQQQHLPPRQNFIHPNNFIHNQAHTAHSITVPAPSIADSLIPPPISPPNSNFIQKNEFTSAGSSGLFESHESEPSNQIYTGSLLTSSTGSLNAFAQSGSSSSLPSSLAFTSIGSTNNFNHPGLDEGLSQVISETFANAGVGENIEKHIYVHVPPDDLEERGHQHIQPLPIAQPKKHYKIIFIKAPNQQPSTNVYTQIAQQQATEEKTLVYVLVKKPDEPTIQDIQQIQSTYKPSKPEVYFIKYKTHRDNEGTGHHGFENVDLTNGNFQGSDLSTGIDIRGSFNGESNTISDTLSASVIEPRIPIGGNVPAQVYGPPGQQK
ncbi:hypothetical protein ACFFRR_005582 [Megaselia abdita]